MKKIISRKNNRGLSAVIGTLLILMLLMAVTVIIWTFVNKTVKEKTSSTSSCFDLFEKVVLNNDYTCYNISADNVQFSVGIADIDVDGIVVAISSESGSKSFTITKTTQTISGLRTFDGSTSVVVPGKNSGTTYIADGFYEQPDSIKIAPIIEENQCEVTDSINNIDICQ